ncbi:MAG: hypothetical protein ACUZ8E_04210, partial [Candidatus Anammoxibacter sp.]
LKDFLTQATNSFDAFYDQLLTNYSARFETIANRDFEEQARSKSFNAGKLYYYLPAFPIKASPAPVVTLRTTTMTVTTDYFVSLDEGLIEWRYLPTWTDPLEITIVWTGGFGILENDTVTSNVDVVKDVPADLQNALIMQCAYAFQRRSALGGSNVSMPNGSIGFQVPYGLLPEVFKTVMSYRKTPQRT